MKTLTLFAVMLLLSVSCFSFREEEVQINREEAKKTFLLINDVRANPEKYAQEYRIARNLVVTRTPLRWNDTLAKAAEAKAYDMAQKNYVDHVDRKGYGMNHYIHQAGYRLNPNWIRGRGNNNFESIAGGYHTAEEVVKTLIIDANTPSMGHRNHLLGIGQWNASLYDIGIGFAHSDGIYGTYVSILIAKHDF